MDPQHRPDQDPQHPERPDRPPNSAGGWSAPGTGPSGTQPGAGPSATPSNPYSSPQSPYGPAVSASPYGVGPQQAPGRPGPYALAARPGIIPLRPQTLSDVLEGSFAALRLSPAAVLGTMLIVALAQSLLVGLPLAYLFTVILQGELFTTAGTSFETTDAEAAWSLLNSMLILWGLIMLAALLGAFLSTIAQGVLSVTVARGAVGLKTTLGQAWRLTGRSVGSLIGLTALYLAVGLVTVLLVGAVLVLVGLAVSSMGDGSAWPVVVLMMLLMLGSIPLFLWLYIKVVLAPAAIAIEQIGPWAGIRRSWSLTRGAWWRTFGIVLLVGVIVGIVTSLISGGLTSVLGMFMPGSGSTAEEIFGMATVAMVVVTVLSTLIQAVGTAYLTLVMAVLYIDYRIRQESFDLELGQTAAQSGAGDPDARFSALPGSDGGSGTSQLVPGRASSPARSGQTVPR